MTETLEMIRQEFGKDSVSRTRKVQTHETERGQTDEDQNQEQAHHIL
jgi:hypothetical protein